NAATAAQGNDDGSGKADPPARRRASGHRLGRGRKRKAPCRAAGGRTHGAQARASLRLHSGTCPLHDRGQPGRVTPPVFLEMILFGTECRRGEVANASQSRYKFALVLKGITSKERRRNGQEPRM